mmetsp:Transcript_38681/g.78899  ORF Transcript_38681/g.78899 Transcript_38681/m.78899 type:complete len:472 (-) Transcript_38681:238-1653(-)|eukprot:CAMPEP_0183307142 /NCGR_PEP_ID=MMETSP0160_2-20130417/16443_1 /TAXON_ID=2839 ORGANISM="Odontella Sinensis, Strain Grunow 1884" /NCGR_SAMPLE_ID=MMETSP0160_2 /ASSEMBLY_ACC=CAM_ASM_000250 /LENGTH=471 /DNA_ID=CAMNT_0025470667 /DNA_START=80 /DNA_END=1495 /DNA_ORIENTATION=+
MKWSASALPLLALAMAPHDVRCDGSEVLSIHGSGTTNPSKCIWLHMQSFMDRAKLPVRLTYRAVGSSTGQWEFQGVNNTGVGAYVPHNDFGAGDIPISSSKYEAMKDKGIGIVHLPFVLGAISLFHNIPGVPDGPGGLNMTSCLLAKIFKREITYWDDEEIVNNNNENLPNLLPYKNFPIKVARRVLGSSSTASVTEYLHTGCQAEWPITMVGKEITWPSDTMECEGSGGMTDCIRNNEGAIGYIDSGHGHEEGLVEIELMNKDGTYLNSKKASEEGGIGDAASGIPGSADADFGDVKLLNKPGKWTWPIVAMSYFYVRKDLSFIDSPAEQSLLKTFLQETFYDDDEIKKCEQFGFTPVPAGIRNVALAGIEMLQVADDAPTWVVERDTIEGGGQDNYVISYKRRTFAEYERSIAVADSKEMDGGVGEVQKELPFTDADEQKLNTALGLAAASFTLWALTIVGLIGKRCLS